MPDYPGGKQGGLFGGVFARGGAETGDTAWLQAMLDAEAGLARALERAGLAPRGAGAEVTEAAKVGNFDIGELGQQAALTGNPVPGLARALARSVSGTAAKAVHQGATSQDIVDTAAMLLARQAIDATRADLERAADAAAGLADAHRRTLMIGRTLLQQAVPVTFGVVAAGWLAGLDAAAVGLVAVRENRLAVQFGGAAGTLASLGGNGTRVAALFAEELGLPLPPLPWHTERLRVIDVATAMARVTAALGKIARDVTLLAQTEVGEVSEGTPDNSKMRTGATVGSPAGATVGSPAGATVGSPAGAGGSSPGGPAGASTGGPAVGSAPRRGGSSAMPHKNNPVASIAILGCARQVPGNLATLVASAEQEHQRAAGAWHAEWQPFSDVLRLAASAAAWGKELFAHLDVDAARMAANLAAAGGLPLAEHVTALLASTLGPSQAHDVVASAAARAAASGLPLQDVLLATPQLEKRLNDVGITAEQIEAALDPAGYLGSSEEFITRALDSHRAAGQDR